MSPSSSDPRARRAKQLKWAAAIIMVVLAIAGGLLGLRSPMLHQYEYQEDVYLSLNGSAIVYVTASIPALVALHGMDLPVDPSAPVDRVKLRALFSGPGVTASSISMWRRHGRRFASVRVDTADVRRLSEALPFERCTFEFARSKTGYRFVEHVGPAATLPVGRVGWSGDELVGYRWHIPSKIDSHNTLEVNFLRGNILVWEQSLAARQAGVPLRMDVDMQPQSILYRTLWLFGLSAASAMAVVVLFLWWIVRKGRPRAAKHLRRAGPKYPHS
jgi:hypothetical protein